MRDGSISVEDNGRIPVGIHKEVSALEVVMTKLVQEVRNSIKILIKSGVSRCCFCGNYQII
jgi:hypothetical protein